MVESLRRGELNSKRRREGIGGDVLDEGRLIGEDFLETLVGLLLRFESHSHHSGSVRERLFDRIDLDLRGIVLQEYRHLSPLTSQTVHRPDGIDESSDSLSRRMIPGLIEQGGVR